MEIASFIAHDNPARALTFVDELEQKCHVLGVSPGLGTSRPELGAGVKMLPFGRYLIFYREANSLSNSPALRSARNRTSLARRSARWMRAPATPPAPPRWRKTYRKTYGRCCAGLPLSSWPTSQGFYVAGSSRTIRARGVNCETFELPNTDIPRSRTGFLGHETHVCVPECTNVRKHVGQVAFRNPEPSRQRGSVLLH